jgi:hypothetical protein
MVTARLSRPLQRRCAQCRRVQEVRLAALYHIVVPNRGGGTRRDGGYDCRFCGTANPIPATEMPQGLVATLPSRDEQRAAATAPPLPHPVAEAPESAPPQVRPAQPIAATATRPPPTDRTAPPAWVVGGAAHALLKDAVRRTGRAADGFCTAYVRDAAGVMTVVELRDRVEPDAFLAWLDHSRCELLVLGGTGPDGSRWTAVFHPFAGAATLAVEPAI